MEDVIRPARRLPVEEAPVAPRRVSHHPQQRLGRSLGDGARECDDERGEVAIVLRVMLSFVGLDGCALRLRGGADAGGALHVDGADVEDVAHTRPREGVNVGAVGRVEVLRRWWVELWRRLLPRDDRPGWQAVMEGLCEGPLHALTAPSEPV